jgi:hypothetical protein
MGSLKVKETFSQWTQPDGSVKVAEKPNYYATMRVIYFKKKGGVLSACVGNLWDWRGDKSPESAEDFLKHCSTRVYGPNLTAKWNGKDLWGQTEISSILYYRDLLDPILKNYPEIPEGYDGWWEFE